MHNLAIAPPPTIIRRTTNPHCTAAWHGTWSAYRHGCQCTEAREAERITRKRLREGRHHSSVVDATGTRRRLQALQALGWRWTDLAPRFGVTSQAVQMWSTGRQVYVETMRRVVVVYDALSTTRGPSEITRHRAEQKGWVPPQAWDDDNIDSPDATADLGAPEDDQADEVAVTLALAGTLTWGSLATPDRAAYIAEARRRGMSAAAASSLVRVGQNYYQRWAERHVDGQRAA